MILTPNFLTIAFLRVTDISIAASISLSNAWKKGADFYTLHLALERDTTRPWTVCEVVAGGNRIGDEIFFSNLFIERWLDF